MVDFDKSVPVAMKRNVPPESVPENNADNEPEKRPESDILASHRILRRSSKAGMTGAKSRGCSQTGTLRPIRKRHPRLGSHLLRAYAIDGRRVSTIRFDPPPAAGAWSKARRFGPPMQMLAIRYYDGVRRPNSHGSRLGPIPRHAGIGGHSRILRGPPAAREAIVRNRINLVQPVVADF